MKALRIILYSFTALVVVVLIAGMIFISGIKQSGKPKYKGELVLEGLNGDVTVYRDERGMPHIYAKDEHDLYYAVGYVMAQERLWQMDLIRRATTGRLSEIFGGEYVNTDLFLRSLDMTGKSRRVLEKADPEIVKCMQAYTDGVNYYIAKAGKKLSPEFRILAYRPDPWKLEDLANIIGYMGWDLASDNLSSDINYYRIARKLGPEIAAKLIPDFKAVKDYVFPGFTLDEAALKSASEFVKNMDKLQALGLSTFSGSNNWAVAGSRTWTGKPVLSNDMHLSLASPGIWIQMHQVVPGSLNVTGVIVPGQPFVVAGHNEKIVWGMTNLMVDDIDLFAEKINPEDSTQYWFNGEWKKMRVKEEIIRIKGGEERKMYLRFTHRGPVVSGFRNVKDAVLTMRWSGYDYSDEIRSVYLLNRASDWADFRSAISSFSAISQNFVYADVDGNIGLNTGGGIAIRKGNGTLIRSGETDEYDWKGYVPFEQLPSSFNPDTGYVSSANNRTVGDDYPYYISSEFAMPYRIMRIRQMMSEKKVFDLADFRRMITDQHSAYAALLTPRIIEACKDKQDMDPSERFALSQLSKWDYDMDMDKAAPAVFELFRPALARNLLSDDLGDLWGELNGTGREYFIYRLLMGEESDLVDDCKTEKKENLGDIISKSFRDCVSELSSSLGADTLAWKWGDMHKISLDHPLGSVKTLDKVFGFNSKKYRIGGSNHTVSPYSYGAGFKVNHGASERHIFNTADWDESLTVIPTGNSGVISSEFYLSQTETYLKKEFYKDHFSEKAVTDNAKYKLVLKAAK
ncbi:MAG: penicillin acylase family protein [Bacteroidales bacterium]